MAEQPRVAVVLGTRPEIVKLAGLICCLGPVAQVIHTGQHYDATMSEVFFAELAVTRPEVSLAVGGQSRATQIASVLGQLDDQFAQRAPAAVVVQGDTNATLAGALAANARGIPLVHVEAGLRSYDAAMPEEHNRVLTDHLADLLCAATSLNAGNLARESVRGRVEVTGNTVVEAVLSQLPPGEVRDKQLVELGLRADGYVLATIHRPENTDSPERLRRILTDLAALPLPVVFPMHPRTAQAVTRHGLSGLLARLTVCEPLGSKAFLGLAAHSAVLVSDSGGVQEECTILKRPLVVVRNSTERPESMADFAVLVRPEQDVRLAVERMLADLPERLARLARLPSPYGDGTASRRVAELVRELID